MSKFTSFFWDILQTVLSAAAIFIIGYLFVFQPHQVVGNSMLPNFYDGEYLLTDKLTYRFRAPERGEVIVFKAPPDPSKDYIKRIVGLPGEKIKIERGEVSINNQALKENYLDREQSFTIASGPFLKSSQEIIVPPNDYFVLGDNRNHSSDSREWGFVPRENIIGKAFIRYWPTAKIGLIPKAE